MLNCDAKLFIQLKCIHAFKKKQTCGLDINGFVVHSDHSMCVQQIQVPHTKFLMKEIRIYFTLLHKNVFTSLFYLTGFNRNKLRSNAILYSK